MGWQKRARSAATQDGGERMPRVPSESSSGWKASRRPSGLPTVNLQTTTPPSANSYGGVGVKSKHDIQTRGR